MTRIESDAEWIKKKRKSILKAASEISDIIMDQNLGNQINDRHKDFFRISFQVSMCMRGVCFHVSNQDNEAVVNLDIYCMDMIFDECYLRGGMYKDRIEENIKKAMSTLNQMKTIALKYAKLNNSLK